MFNIILLFMALFIHCKQCILC